MKDRPHIQSLLITWWSAAHKANLLRATRPSSFIIDNANIKLLATILPSRIQVPSHITEFLNEMKEWSACWAIPIFDVIDNPPPYCSPTPTSSVTSRASSIEPPPKHTKIMATEDPLKHPSFHIWIPAHLKPVVLQEKTNI